MKSSAAAFAVMLLAGGTAWGASDGDDQQRYQDCTALSARDANAAFDAALAWRNEKGGAPAWHCVGLSLVELGYDAEAAEVFERIAEDMARGTLPKETSANRASLRAALLGQAGQAWLQAGNPKRARVALDAGLALDPDSPELLVDRAQAQAALGAYWEAVDDLSLALDTAPSRSDVYAFRAAAYRYLEILDLAADDVERAFALAPDDPTILLERGNIRRLGGDDAGARQDWLRILNESPESPAARAAQANIERLDVKQE
jgi:tetratricopeptide (TPR) repeat protein